MALTGMSVKDWKEALDFSTRKVKSLGIHQQGHHLGQEGGPRGMEMLVKHFKELNKDTEYGKWEVDQV